MHAIWIPNYIFVTDHIFYVLTYAIELVNRFISDAGLVCNDYRIMDRNYVSYILKVKFMDLLIFCENMPKLGFGGRRHSMYEAAWVLK